jgi:hypothetical protein
MTLVERRADLSPLKSPLKRERGPLVLKKRLSEPPLVVVDRMRPGGDAELVTRHSRWFI